jgi:hypothetical protein
LLTWQNIRFGLRIFFTDVGRKRRGFKQYKGGAKEICRQIVKDCWNDDYYMGSAGHFSDFWLRDFCLCLEGLLKEGHEKECKKSLRYALSKYKEYNSITTTISPDGVPFHSLTFGWESVAYLLRCIVILKDREALEEYRDFLNSMIAHYFERYVEKDTGLPLKSYHFTSMKDFAKRKQACVDVCFLAETKKNAKLLRLNNPFERYDYEKILMEGYWTGDYFLDDLSGRKYIAGDANVIPFWLGVVKDKKVLRKAIDTLREHKFDDPMPLRYTHHAEEDVDFHLVEIFASGYEKSTTWPQLGLLYIGIVRKLDKKLAEKYLDSFTKMIESYKNFPELFTRDMKPFKTPFYFCDEGMDWAAIYLELIR